MLRVILLLILIVLVARTFWRVIDGLVDGFSGRRTTSEPSRSTRLVRDPVCGTWVLPKNDMSLMEGRQQVFFCSAACRDHYRSRTA
jgi:hypothetical protein